MQPEGSPTSASASIDFSTLCHRSQQVKNIRGQNGPITEIHACMILEPCFNKIPEIFAFICTLWQ